MRASLNHHSICLLVLALTVLIAGPGAKYVIDQRNSSTQYYIPETWACAPTYSPDCKYLFVPAADVHFSDFYYITPPRGTVLILDAKTNKLIKKLLPPSHSCQWVSSNRLIYQTNREIKIIDLEKDQTSTKTVAPLVEACEIIVDKMHPSCVLIKGCSSSLKLLDLDKEDIVGRSEIGNNQTIGSYNFPYITTIDRHDLNDGNILNQFARVDLTRSNNQQNILNHKSPRNTECATTKSWFVARDIDGFNIWRSATGEKIPRIHAKLDLNSSYWKISEDDRYMFFEDNGIQIYDLVTCQLIHKTKPVHSYWTAAFSPDSTKLMIRINNHYQILDLRSGIIKHKFAGPEGAGILTWLPDSQTLVQENVFFRLFDLDGNLCSDIDDAKHAVMITPEWCNPSSYFLEKP